MSGSTHPSSVSFVLFSPRQLGGKSDDVYGFQLFPCVCIKSKQAVCKLRATSHVSKKDKPAFMS